MVLSEGISRPLLSVQHNLLTVVYSISSFKMTPSFHCLLVEIKSSSTNVSRLVIGNNFDQPEITAFNSVQEVFYTTRRGVITKGEHRVRIPSFDCGYQKEIDNCYSIWMDMNIDIASMQLEKQSLVPDSVLNGRIIRVLVSRFANEHKQKSKKSAKTKPKRTIFNYFPSAYYVPSMGPFSYYFVMIQSSAKYLLLTRLRAIVILYAQRRLDVDIHLRVIFSTHQKILQITTAGEQ